MSSVSFTEKVLVTGANGFVAAHLVNQLFVLGYDIVGTVRSADKGEWIAQRITGFKYEIVENISAPNAFDEVFKKHPDIAYVFHTASPLCQTEEFKRDLIDPAVEGTKSALEASHKYGKNVKKFVFTASIAGIFPMGNGSMKKNYVFINEESWNPIEYEEGTENWGNAYCVGKKYAEKAIWEFEEKVKPKFAVSVIIAPLTHGPPIHQTNYKDLRSSMANMRRLFELPFDTKTVPDMFIGHCDVRDMARIHVMAIQTDRLDGQRWLPITGYGDDQVVLDILHKYRPEETAKCKMTFATPGSFDPKDYYSYDVSKTMKAIDFECIPLEKSVLDEFDGVYRMWLEDQEKKESK